MIAGEEKNTKSLLEKNKKNTKLSPKDIKKNTKLSLLPKLLWSLSLPRDANQPSLSFILNQEFVTMSKDRNHETLV